MTADPLWLMRQYRRPRTRLGRAWGRARRWTREKLVPCAWLVGVFMFPATAILIQAAPAQADVDDVEAAYIQTYGPSAVCPVIATYPTEAGVMGVVQGIHEDGFTYPNAVEIVNVSVYQYCPEWWPLLVQIGRDARGETARTLA